MPSILSIPICMVVVTASATCSFTLAPINLPTALIICDGDAPMGKPLRTTFKPGNPSISPIVSAPIIMAVLVPFCIGVSPACKPS